MGYIYLLVVFLLFQCANSMTYWEFGQDSRNLVLISHLTGSIGIFEKVKQISIPLPTCMETKYVLVEVNNMLTTPAVTFNRHVNTVTITYKLLQSSMSYYEIFVKGRRSSLCNGAGSFSGVKNKMRPGSSHPFFNDHRMENGMGKGSNHFPSGGMNNGMGPGGRYPFPSGAMENGMGHRGSNYFNDHRMENGMGKGSNHFPSGGMNNGMGPGGRYPFPSGAMENGMGHRGSNYFNDHRMENGMGKGGLNSFSNGGMQNGMGHGGSNYFNNHRMENGIGKYSSQNGMGMKNGPGYQNSGAGGRNPSWRGGAEDYGKFLKGLSYGVL